MKLAAVITERRVEEDARPRGMSFQGRIVGAALITAVAVLVTACFLFIFEQWRAERRDLIQNQTELAQVLAVNVAPALERRDLASARSTLAALGAPKGLRSAYLIDAQGKRFAELQPGGGDPGVKNLISVRTPVEAHGKRIGELVLTARADRLAAILPRYLAVSWALFFAATGLALFLGRWLAGRVMEPVGRLSKAMREVTVSGDYGQRVERSAEDEFGILTDSFNALLAQLQFNDLALRQTMTELVEARDAAEAANVLKSQFLANMSHEIRTPLNGVLAMAQIMEMDALTPAQRERLDVIRSSGEALLTVLNDILDLSKIEAGKVELEPAEFDAGQVGRGAVAAFEALAARKGLALDLVVAPSARGLRRGDAARLGQILSNLISNAVKFTNEGAIKVVIAGEGEDGCEGLRLIVSDTGIGIPSDKLPMLFQKFSQIDSSTTRRFGGTGLGLAICRELAQMMGGSIWAQSDEGRGSSFIVSVPLPRIAEAPAHVEHAHVATDTASSDDDRPLRVLAAEDNATNRLVLRTVMETFGADMLVVEDGKLAVEAWERGDFDVILMDIQMPEMDGLSATRVIRAAERESRRRRTPIIAVSANAMTHQVKEYLSAGMDAHVAKPIELTKLHAALERVLAAAEAEQAA